jgi:signal transduction histidine kinase
MFRFLRDHQTLSRLISYVQRCLVILCLAISSMAMAFTRGPAFHDLQISLVMLAFLLASSLHFPDRPDRGILTRIFYVFFETTCITGSMLFGISRLCMPLYMVTIAKACLLLSGRPIFVVLFTCLLFQTVAYSYKASLFPLLISKDANPITNLLVFAACTTMLNGANMALIFMAAAVMMLLVSEQKSRLKAEQLSGEVEQLASELERARIAREIHDTLGHTLTSLKLQMEVARQYEDLDRQRSKTAFARAEQLSALALTDVRLALQSIREQDFDLGAAINSLKADAESAGKLSIEVSLYQTDIPASTSYQLFRIIQECLTNTMKHAAATRVEISTRVEESNLILSVKDNGSGFSGDIASRGYGLKGMRERVANLSGTIDISNSEGAGTAVTVAVPLPRRL